MKTRTSLKLVAAITLSLTLSACESAEERAENHYQSALALLDEGDTERAVVELLNVFQLNGFHRDARWTLAQIHLEKGEVRPAYSQLLRLAEQYPDDAEVRLLLAELAFDARNFDEFKRHGEASISLVPEDPQIRPIETALEYRQALVDTDDAAMNRIASQVRTVLEDYPDNRMLLSILVDQDVRNGNLSGALTYVDRLLESDPENKQIHEQRLSLVAQMEDTDKVEAQLLTMIEKFDDDTEIKATLLRFYLADRQVDKAETFLRDISSPSDEDPSAFVDLIRFISQVKGEDAALVEIERAIAENPEPGTFRALRASFWFNAGREDEAIAELEDVIANGEGIERLNSIKLTLARMLSAQDNDVGARRLVEEVIADDPIEREALKMRALWQIEADEIDAAISDLRVALDAEPDDAEALTMLAQAYNRLGRHSLSRDFLAQAAQASNNAPEETIRFANLLIEEEEFLPAEDALIASLRLNPQNVNLLGVLGRVYVAMEDKPRTQQVIDTLRSINSETATSIANALEADILNKSAGTEEAIAFLEQLAEEEGDLRSKMFLLRGRIATGDIDGARGLLRTMREEQPNSLALKSVGASIDALAGDFDQAETGFREILEENPQIARNWLELSRLLTFQGKVEEAGQAIADGLAANPGEPSLLWAQASILELNGDIDGAIGIYETLYESQSNSLVIANNLASLISTYRDDDESLERAFVIARRLQGTDVPQFQDTIGWILHRRGENEEALPYLESAAAALPNDALTQYHLGMVQSALGRKDEAIVQLQRAVSLADSDDTRPQFQIAREEILRLQSQ